MITLEDALTRLDKVKQTSPNKWQACCPAHEDEHPSLSVSEGEDGRALLYCHAGCSFENVLAAIPRATAVTSFNGRVSANGKNGHESKRIVTTYDYGDEHGRLLYQKVRYEPKDFRVRRPSSEGWQWFLGDVDPVLYRLPALAQARPSEEVFIPEGERDVDRLVDLELIATCNFDGAGKWRPEYNQWFAGLMVYVIADNDAPGRAHAELVASNLHDIAVSVKVVHLPGLGEHGDVSDWLDQGHTVEDLRHFSYAAELWQPTPDAAVTVTSGRETAVDRITQADGRMPALPESATIDPAIGAGICPWLDAYIDFSRRMSPRGYDAFHEATAVWLLSTIAAGRIGLHLGRKSFYPSLYIAFCAHTTLYAKSSTARIAQDVLAAAGLSFLLMPNDTTPQAMISEMTPRVCRDYGEMNQGQQEREKKRLLFSGQRGWFYDEFGTKIRAMMQDNGVMASYRGLLRVFDDHPPVYEYITMTRRDLIERPCLALLASMTPADIKPYAKSGAALWRDGFWARFALITPPIDETAVNGRFPNHEISIPEELTRPLLEWHNRLGVPNVVIEEAVNDKGDPTGRFNLTRDDIQPISCTLGAGVLDAFYAYHDGLTTIAQEQAQAGNSDLIGNYGRFSEKAMRIAMLLASLSNNGRIELAHWARAQTITEQWRACLHNLIEQVSRPAPTEESQRQEQVIGALSRHGAQTANEISRYVRSLSGAEVDELCKRLVKAGVIVVEGKTQKGTNRYALAET